MLVERVGLGGMLLMMLMGLRGIFVVVVVRGMAMVTATSWVRGMLLSKLRLLWVGLIESDGGSRVTVSMMVGIVGAAVVVAVGRIPPQ